MADQWTQALERIQAERELEAKRAKHRQLVKAATKRAAELRDIRSLMRPA